MSDELTWHRFFTRYAAAFDAFDAEAIASFYNVPCMLIRSAQVASLSTPDAVLSNMRALLATYRSQGYKRARFRDLWVASLDPGLVLVTVQWEVELTDASSTDVFRNTYQIVDLGAQQRIVVSAMHKAGGVRA